MRHWQFSIRKERIFCPRGAVFQANPRCGPAEPSDSQAKVIDCPGFADVRDFGLPREGIERLLSLLGYRVRIEIPRAASPVTFL